MVIRARECGSDPPPPPPPAAPPALYLAEMRLMFPRVLLRMSAKLSSRSWLKLPPLWLWLLLLLLLL